jgi:hypothetical protein
MGLLWILGMVFVFGERTMPPQNERLVMRLKPNDKKIIAQLKGIEEYQSLTQSDIVRIALRFLLKKTRKSK